MSLLAAAIHAAEGLPAPDGLRRAAIAWLVEGQRRELLALPENAAAAFVRDMRERPIAEHVGAANDQHYELPPEFFRLVLGPRLKYSSCLYRHGVGLAEAEEIALAETCEHAGLADGQRILELGCGWGSLSLWMAERYPAARITAVSNSHGQRRHIEAQARARRLTNLTVVTADANAYEPKGRFDRVVSVEMFEHMANWDQLLGRVRDWLEPDGRLFLHVFSSRTAPYRFSHEDPGDWIGKYFFTGGFMPSHDLIRDFPDLFAVEADWRWSGAHYEKTALDWLANMDRNDLAIRRIMRDVYGADAGLWRRRWRLFFLATAGLFGHRGGAEWGVSHYRLKPA
jgi:cyclopropane-fatty-acyl-phospholipid synthase